MNGRSRTVSSRQSFWGTVVGVMICASAQMALAEESAETNALPTAIQRVLAWLPEDTETLLASQNFTIRPWDAEFSPLPFNPWSSLRLMPFIELVESEDGRYFRPLARAHRKVALA